MIRVAEVNINTTSSASAAVAVIAEQNENYGKSDKYILENTDISLASTYVSVAEEDLMQAGQDTE